MLGHSDIAPDPKTFIADTTWMTAAIPQYDMNDLNVSFMDSALAETRVYEAISYTKQQFEPGSNLENNEEAKKIFSERLACNKSRNDFSDTIHFNITV